MRTNTFFRMAAIAAAALFAVATTSCKKEKKVDIDPTGTYAITSVTVSGQAKETFDLTNPKGAMDKLKTIAINTLGVPEKYVGMFIPSMEDKDLQEMKEFIATHKFSFEKSGDIKLLGKDEEGKDMQGKVGTWKVEKGKVKVTPVSGNADESEEEKKYMEMASKFLDNSTIMPSKSGLDIAVPGKDIKEGFVAGYMAKILENVPEGVKGHVQPIVDKALGLVEGSTFTLNLKKQ